MYINKDWKFYKQDLIEITDVEILELLNSKQETKQKIKNKLELEDNNLWKPTNPKIRIWHENTSDWFPQAWNNNWKWCYNWQWDLQEAEYLGKKIPTKEQWKEIVKPFWKDWKSLSEKLNLPFVGYRSWYNDYYNNQSVGASYWSSTPYSNLAYNLYYSTNIIYPADSSNRGDGFSVRCLKD